jgi:hypothetical protein
MCQELPDSDIPLTWRDAILITRRVGYRYLWIGSLCIIQDSKDDWLVESGRMSEVYEGATLTIAAESSPDSPTGIFRPSESSRSRRAANVVAVPCRSGTDNFQGTLFFRPPLKTPETCRGALSSRAWTLQEYTLSRRVLLYSRDRLFWICLEEQNCEAQPIDSLSPWDSNNSLKIPWKIEDEDGDPIQDPIRGWYALVNEYSRRKITFKTDRLLAVSVSWLGHALQFPLLS